MPEWLENLQWKDLFRFVVEHEFKDFTRLDFDTFAGAQSRDPKIATGILAGQECTAIADGDILVLIVDHDGVPEEFHFSMNEAIDLPIKFVEKIHTDEIYPFEQRGAY